MTKRTNVGLEWVSDQTFLLRDRFDFPIVMAQPKGANAADLLTLSLIGCTSWDVVEIMLKQRQDLTSYQVTATTEQDEDPPWKIRRITVHYRFTGEGLRLEAVQKAIEISEKKYCSIYATLSEVVEIVSEIEIKSGE